jgi:hypothetical protein
LSHSYRFLCDVKFLFSGVDTGSRVAGLYLLRLCLTVRQSPTEVHQSCSSVMASPALSIVPV